jgi:hypothetical protein
MVALFPGALRNLSLKAFERCVGRHAPSEGSTIQWAIQLADFLQIELDPQVGESLAKCERFTLEMKTTDTLFSVTYCDRCSPPQQFPFRGRTTAQMLGMLLDPYSLDAVYQPVDVTRAEIVFDNGYQCSQFAFTSQWPFGAHLAIKFEHPGANGRPKPPDLVLDIYQSGGVGERCAAGQLLDNDFATYNQVMNCFYGGPCDTGDKTKGGHSVLTKWSITEGANNYATWSSVRSASPYPDHRVEEETTFTLLHTPQP